MSDKNEDGEDPRHAIEYRSRAPEPGVSLNNDLMRGVKTETIIATIVSMKAAWYGRRSTHKRPAGVKGHYRQLLQADDLKPALRFHLH
jgi:hypothetical protein